jgi:hypothetical protein
MNFKNVGCKESNEEEILEDIYINRDLEKKEDRN